MALALHKGRVDYDTTVETLKSSYYDDNAMIFSRREPFLMLMPKDRDDLFLCFKNQNTSI